MDEAVPECQAEELLVLSSILDDQVFKPYVEGNGGQLKINVDLDHEIELAFSSAADQDGAVGGHPSLDTFGPPVVVHLPAVLLDFVFPVDYPKCNPPIVDIESDWISKESEGKIKGYLLDKWKEGGGEVVVFTWFEVLKKDLLPLILKDEKYLECTYDCAQLLLMYQSSLKAVSFNESFQTCQICFESYRGSEFSALPNCGHLFCKQCLKGHAEFQIEQGHMTRVHCPESACDGLIDGGTIKSLVKPELFQRFDKIMLNFAIRSMSATDWCPRFTCQHPADIHEDHGECAACGFAFCLKCQRAYHGKNPCNEEVREAEQQAKERREAARQRMLATPAMASRPRVIPFQEQLKSGTARPQYVLPGGAKAEDSLAFKYTTASAKKKAALEAQFGKTIMQFIVFNSASRANKEKRKSTNNTWVSKAAKAVQTMAEQSPTKPCPTCKIPITKAGGCKYMVCNWCHTSFCWICVHRFPCHC